MLRILGRFGWLAEARASQLGFRALDQIAARGLHPKTTATRIEKQGGTDERKQHGGPM